MRMIPSQYGTYDEPDLFSLHDRRQTRSDGLIGRLDFVRPRSRFSMKTL